MPIFIRETVGAPDGFDDLGEEGRISLAYQMTPVDEPRTIQIRTDHREWRMTPRGFLNCIVDTDAKREFVGRSERYILAKNTNFIFTFTGRLSGWRDFDLAPDQSGDRGILSIAVHPEKQKSYAAFVIAADKSGPIEFGSAGIHGKLKEFEACFKRQVNVNFVQKGQLNELEFPELDMRRPGPLFLSQFRAAIEQKIGTVADRHIVFAWNVEGKVDVGDQGMTFGYGARYCYVDQFSPWSTIAHEIGHTFHLSDLDGRHPKNIMSPIHGVNRFNMTQIETLRSVIDPQPPSR
ncbi:MAG: hypothetical protein BGP06_14390 [Rhizobiales bacterium 65-9]|nr:hypothetical protein [Hyphomicrobiales bacterium]OJY36856.1 MAG: hypothetical protein BGP06_14390 [Rhizobiales bacterium 65-9]